jgi:catechol 2,3-dioxygenase-like lactoylglutathione lyase family enzyme
MIHHVSREMPRAATEACVRFYTLLGFRPVPVPEGLRDRALWLERAGTQIHLMPKDDATPQAGHIGVVVEDYRRTVAELAGHGHDVEPRREHWGSPRAYVRDPAGNLIEIMEFPPTSSADRAGSASTGPDGVPREDSR